MLLFQGQYQRTQPAYQAVPGLLYRDKYYPQDRVLYDVQRVFLAVFRFQ